MLKPSSLPLGVRSVEWLRAHHGAWLVNDVERIYYSWTAPKPGGPALRTLPAGRQGRRRFALPGRPVRTARRASLRWCGPRLAGEGVWQRDGPAVGGAPPVLVTTFRADPVYPRLVAYVAWIDHTRTQLALYPGPLRAAVAACRAGRSRCRRASAGGSWRRSTAASPTATATAVSPSTAASTAARAGHGHRRRVPDGRVDVVAWHGGPTPGARRRARAAEPAADRRPRPAESEPERRPGLGRTLGNAIRVWRSGRRHRPARQPDLRRRRLPDGRHARGDPHPRRRCARDRARHQRRMAELHHVRARRRPRPGQARPELRSSRTTRYLVPDDRDFFAIYRAVPGGARAVPLR